MFQYTNVIINSGRQFSLDSRMDLVVVGGIESTNETLNVDSKAIDEVCEENLEGKVR